MIRAIVHVDKEWGIGRNNDMMFSLPKDMKFFRETTMGHTVVMGGKTLRSFPGQKPLPGRVNVALSRSAQQIPGFTMCSSPAEAVELAKSADRAMVIGGGSIYRQMLPYCDTAYVTKVHTKPESDTYFPNLDQEKGWFLAEILQSGEENGIKYEMCLYRKDV